MKPPPDQPDLESQGRARHSVRAVGSSPNGSVDNRGAQGTDAPYQVDESPGVPGFRTWRGIYLFVFAGFVLVVVLLALFSRYFA
jgi:hypothetical protein